MVGIFFGLLVGSQMVIAVADKAPALDVRPSCRAAASEAIPSTKRNVESCMSEERAAHAQINQNWSQFSAAQRETCLQSTSMGGVPSYVEMLTCLEMLRDARRASAADVPRLKPHVGGGARR